MEINWRSIAAMAYASYVTSIDLRVREGKNVEAFSNLPQAEIDAWIAAVKTACEVYGRAVTA
jgi:hypothetical protein